LDPTLRSAPGGADPPSARRRLFGGVDAGSLSTDAVLLDGEGRLAGEAVVATGASIASAVRDALDSALAAAGGRREDVAFLVATGYGRDRVEGAHLRVTEITCHAKGAARLFPGAATVLDVGGQDSKAIRLGPGGKVLDFAMNDKCAAGTGRFLEVMARTLEMDLAELGERSLLSDRPLPVSSMCTVFAESEVVSLIASGAAPADIGLGVHAAVAERLAALAERVGVIEPVVMTGGVAKNPAARRCIERRLRVSLLVPDEPQTAGALGAALVALERGGGTG
jgi:predicted CoA-substrate-specific enzyme activase